MEKIERRKWGGFCEFVTEKEIFCDMIRKNMREVSYVRNKESKKESCHPAQGMCGLRLLYESMSQGCHPYLQGYLCTGRQ
jgi:hypothetical protein